MRPRTTAKTTTSSKGCFRFSTNSSRSLRRHWVVRVVKASNVRGWRCADERHRIHFALLLLAYLLCGYHVLRIRLRHDELAQHLHLLHLGEGELIAHLHGLH